MLEKFRDVKQKEINKLRTMAEMGQFPHPYSLPRLDFTDALKSKSSNIPLAVIAEYKRASPSRGIICDSLAVEDVACQYEDNGAKAISILTETQWFKGDISFINNAWQAMRKTIPILRKDFIIDTIQIDATAVTPASAVLLIVRFTPSAQLLRDLREKAESYGIQCVVEIFDAADLALARESGAQIIQVNSRDLNNFKVDRKASMDFLKSNQPASGELWIAASGMDKKEHLLEAAAAGYNAALVGTALMEGAKPGKALCSLLGGKNHED